MVLEQNFFYKPIPAEKKPFPQWLVPFVRLLEEGRRLSEDWKKRSTNIVAFHRHYEKLIFSDLGPGEVIYMVNSESRSSQNDCAAAFGETERKTLLLSNVPRAGWGTKGAQQLVCKEYRFLGSANLEAFRTSAGLVGRHCPTWVA